jgi:hypothetical protein
MDEETDQHTPLADSVEASAPGVGFPTDPFPCPACGQLLAPSCRVCVACKHPIDPAEITLACEAALPVARVSSPKPQAERVRYPWRIFITVLSVSFLFALLFEGLLGEQRAQLAMGGLQTLAGVWVFFDAMRQRLPRALRWAVGTMLLPVIIFPWYLARRNRPQSSVPFVEAEVGPVTRILLFAVLLAFLIVLIFQAVKSPPGTTPTTPTIQKPAGSGPSRVASIHAWERAGGS